MNIRIIPTLLLLNGGLVKTIRFKKPKYIGDPINAVKIFNDKEVDEIILLDIQASKKGLEPDYNKIQEICSEAFMPFGYGGGINTLDHAKKIFNSGIEKVVLNTAAFEKPKLIEEIAKIYGSQSVVVSIDVKTSLLNNKKVFIHSGTKNIKLSPESFAKMAEEYGAGELIINSIDKEGTYSGFDLELISKISSISGVPIVALGGARSVEDFKLAVKAGASAVAAGSLFVYSGKEKGILINYPSRNELDALS